MKPYPKTRACPHLVGWKQADIGQSLKEGASRSELPRYSPVTALIDVPQTGAIVADDRKSVAKAFRVLVPGRYCKHA
jgi:hypothetical protein